MMPPPKALLQRRAGKDGGNWEELNGLRALKFSGSLLGEKAATFAYLAIPDDHHLVLCSSRPAPRDSRRHAAGNLISPRPGMESFWAAEFYMPALKEAAGKSELLAMLDGRLALKVVPGGEFVDLQSSAENDRTNARRNRARRILEGLVAAMACATSPGCGCPAR